MDDDGFLKIRDARPVDFGSTPTTAALSSSRFSADALRDTKGERVPTTCCLAMPLSKNAGHDRHLRQNAYRGWQERASATAPGTLPN